MKKLLLLLCLVLTACAVPITQSPPSPSGYIYALVEGDVLPVFIIESAAQVVPIGENVDADVLLISDELLQMANDEPVLQSWLCDQATRLPLAAYHSTPDALPRILGIDAPQASGSESTPVLSLLYDPPGQRVYVYALFLPADSQVDEASFLIYHLGKYLPEIVQ